MILNLELLKAGDNPAWELAFKSFYNLITNVLFKYKGNSVSQEDLDDVATEAITKLLNDYVPQAQSIEELQKLVITIAKNQLRDLLDKRNAQKRGQGTDLSLDEIQETGEIDDKSPTPEQLVQIREKAFLVQAAIDQLPPKYAEVVTDYYFLNLKQQEIADKRGLKIGSIGVYLQRGIDALKPILINLHLL